MSINIQESQNNTSTRDNTSTGHFEWTNEMKINLLRIEEQERSRGTGFMKRMKEAWDAIYEEKTMTAHYPTGIYCKGMAEISAPSTGLSSTLGLKMLHVIKPLDDISYLQELEDKDGLKLVKGLKKTFNQLQ